MDEETWTCSTRLMVFDFDMRPEAVYSIEGDVSSFYADPETGLIYINDRDEELIRYGSTTSPNGCAVETTLICF